MTGCPAHGNPIQLTPSGAVNLFGATRPLNQIVVGHVDQLQAVPQAKGAHHKGGFGDTAGRRKCWGSSPWQLFWSGLQGKQVTQAGGLGSTAGPQKKQACSAHCLRFIPHSGFRLQAGMTSGTYADD
jgi:hypothetical protein